MKKFIAVVGLALLLSCLVFTGAASANMAAPVREDYDSGIVFDKFEEVGITSEVLDLTFDKGYASVTAVYNMKNLTAQPLNVNAMFLATAEYGGNKDYALAIDGKPLEFSREYYGTYNQIDGSNVSYDRWREIVQACTVQTRPFGDGRGFYEYTFTASNDSRRDIVVRFSPERYFFSFGHWSYNITDRGEVTLTGQEVKIVTTEAPEFMVESQAVKDTHSRVSDIYDYLFNAGTRWIGSTDDEQRIAKKQFNRYLYYVSERAEAGVGLIEPYSYVTDEIYMEAVSYEIPFEANGEVQLSVSYGYRLGGSSYRGQSTQRFTYLLSPAAYWNDFSGITINLTLSGEMPYLVNSSLPFRQVSDGVFVYESDTLPTAELELVAGNTPFKTRDWVAICMVCSFILPAIALVAAIVLMVCAPSLTGISTRTARLLASISLAALAVIAFVILFINIAMGFTWTGVFISLPFSALPLVPLAIGFVIAMKNRVKVGKVKRNS